jgi:hypothetical protein
MATREFLNIGGALAPAFNVTNRVGPDCSNQPGDIVVVQGMFKFLARFHPRTVAGIKMSGVIHLDGQFTPALGDAILAFQRANRLQVLQADGVIDPASYLHRTIRPGEPRLMTITVLHFFCFDAVLLAGSSVSSDDYTLAIPKMFPQVRGFFDLTKALSP